MPKRTTTAPKNVKKLGAKGGKTTAKRMTQKDPDYYKRIAALVATRII
jgi:hypothetical protein